MEQENIYFEEISLTICYLIFFYIVFKSIASIFKLSFVTDSKIFRIEDVLILVNFFM